MGNSRTKGRKSDTSRDGGGFIALPWSVVDSVAYQRLSAHAKALLLEVARQYVRDNNGRLLLSRAYMGPRGWKSTDMLNKAKAELLASGFIHQTVQGHRPNKASWYALTFYSIDVTPGFDAGAAESFRRGAYRDADPLPKPKPTREELYRKWDRPAKNKTLGPCHGPETPAIGPPHGPEDALSGPPHGPIRGAFDALSGPPHGHHLEMPSPGAVSAHLSDRLEIDGGRTTDKPLKAKTQKSPTGALKAKPTPKAEPVEKTALGLSGEAVEADSDVVRVRDDLPAGYWCEELGEYMKPKPSTCGTGKRKADAIVAALLGHRSAEVAG